ncbi:M12 family metallo-peptidase [Soonwooa sp.]|uniref:zinc-dependent metalloprotease n=1 Tax=Soonwooa sp. TaxID=1938592 RepID=UPI0026028159|nr:M12 family metallo-peptidase [Soonwooa sp.]
MIKNFFTCAAVVLSASVFGQANYWSKTNNVAGKQTTQRLSQPSNFKLYNLNLENIETALKNAPQRDSNNEGLVLKFPDSNGNFVDYVIQEASVLAPELQAKYSDIRSYVGYQKGNKSNTIRFSVTPTDGVNVMYFDGGEVSYMDNYTKDNKTYIVYKRKDLGNAPEKFNCGFSEENEDFINKGLDANKYPVVQDGKFRTYRLALACTYQYANFHVNRAGLSGGTVEQKKAAVLAAMVASMTRVNGVYEKTVSLTMVMVPNNDQIIFLTAADYPTGLTYTNNEGSTMLNQNQNIVDKVIGTANYDIGHVYSTGGGGIAQLQSPCGSGKARGVTGLGTPVNDAFYIDYVAHEMGHQFGANHTFNNNTQGSCTGNRNLSTAFEPGGGSTIMAYAGICGPDNNIQAHSDPYFHGISVNEIYNFISKPNDCSVKTANNNQPPVISDLKDYTIPKSTAFALTASATDPDGDAVTYLWEQMDSQNSTQPPVATATGGPVFRSFIPSTSGVRYFPSMENVLVNNFASKWEIVPTVARNLNFNVSVSDNKATGAQSARAMMQVVVANAGPFKVTSQDAYAQYDAAVPMTVTWDVAGTDAAPINTQFVQILLSKDNGQTFDIAIANSIPNSGSAQVMLPNENIASARIMIRAVDNIYFAVNSAPFAVKKNLAVSDIAKKGFTIYPNPAKGEVNVSIANKSADASYMIYDQSGRLLKQGKVASEKINVSDLSTGTYRMLINNGGDVQSQNLIIKK